ncbi:hypothetical protein GCM10010277_73490 [Streptomyces longisporoflavus]|uniref:peptidoglycan-binding domain-containing protein n=1 Tax=Streptomyces longisporoflavus TaxID=28044 RepID=UPI00167E2F50|nr:peptidoglycan-binding domain-containing protein [Streptomyces longisporoflavus]GGV65991.1 hypothetical protein GCM10010277_73490 [Streptomyces longisporoflavus]
MRHRTISGRLSAAAITILTLGTLAVGVPAAAEVNPGPAQAAAGTCPYSGSHPELSRSDSYSSAVKHAQCLWNTQNSLHGGRKLINQDGYFGTETYSAMHRIQRACGITADGIVGPDTWECLHPDQYPNPRYREGVWPVD